MQNYRNDFRKSHYNVLLNFAVSMPSCSLYFATVLLAMWYSSFPNNSEISEFKNKLKETNLKLWNIENGTRSSEKNKDFGPKFVELARGVYMYNDERAKIKLTINNSLGSNIKEVKHHE